MEFHQHPYGKPTDYLNLSSVTLPYWKLGSGPDVVFVHGWPIDCRTWRNVVDNLKGDHTCHLFDLPGAGWSRWSPQTPLSFASLPKIVAEAVEQMQLEGDSFLFAGHNSGGGFARMSLRYQKRKVAGFALGNTEIPELYSPLFKSIFAFGRSPFIGPAMKAICHLKMTRQLFCLGSRWKDTPLERELTEYFVTPLVKFPAKLDAALSMIKQAGVHNFDALTQAHQLIEGPVRFLWGRRDPWFPLKDLRTILPSFRAGAQLRVVDNAGLMVHEEEPDLFAQEVRTLSAATIRSSSN